MLRGLYTAATGMITQRRALDVVANNIANIRTKGFKRDQVVNRSFQDELVIRMDRHGKTPFQTAIGPLNHGVYVDRLVVSFEQGPLEDTGQMTDLALTAPGFFTVITDEGERYTRNGAFLVDSQGVLVTEDGYPVMGEQGLVYVGHNDFTIDTGGYVMVDDQVINRLSVVNFGDLTAMRKIGDSIFENIDPQNQRIEYDGEVLQRALEGSNTDPLRETVNMMTAARSYESNQKVLQMIVPNM
jgi:flagellar basal-body rod protein FlgF